MVNLPLQDLALNQKVSFEAEFNRKVVGKGDPRLGRRCRQTNNMGVARHMMWVTTRV